MRNASVGAGVFATGMGLAVILACGGPSSAGPAATATPAFWRVWGDGKAELSGYAITTTRYGAPREGQVV